MEPPTSREPEGAMNDDLMDLLAAWTGQPTDERRQQQLLARLGNDAAFRKAFVEELRMLGMLSAVQSAEPRWLELEDELGWSSTAASPDEQAFAESVMNRLDLAAARRRRVRWVSWGLGMAAVLMIGLGLGFILFHSNGTGGPAARPDAVAVVTQLDNVRWGSGESSVAEGATLAPRRFRLDRGHATLDLFNGVTLNVEGPADFEIASLDRVICHRGKLRARVPENAGGFAVTAPGVAVLDPGTEYAMNVAVDGKARIMVFKGRPQVSILGEQGDTLRNMQLKEEDSVAIDSGTRRIETAMAMPMDFAPLPVPTPTPSDLNDDYASYVRAAGPWGYWRFERVQEDRIPNEIPDRPAIALRGGVEIESFSGANHSLLFPSAQSDHYALMEGTWDAPLGSGFAMEMWLMAQNIDAATIAALIGPAAPGVKDQDPHGLLLELTGRSRELIHQPGAMRYLLRLPPGNVGGVNTFTRKLYVPQRWYHVVAQRTGDRMELFLNGDKAGEAQLGPGEKSEARVPCRLLLGRLKISPQTEPGNIRSFVGRLDELALYDRALTAQEIKQHYEAGRGMMQGKR